MKTAQIIFAIIAGVALLLAGERLFPPDAQMAYVEAPQDRWLIESQELRDSLRAMLITRAMNTHELQLLGEAGNNLNIKAGERYNVNKKLVSLQNELLIQILLQLQSNK